MPRSVFPTSFPDQFSVRAYNCQKILAPTDRMPTGYSLRAGKVVTFFLPGVSKLNENRIESEEEIRLLIDEIRRGRADRFELLVKRYQNGLATLARRFFRNPADIEEVLQEIFLRVFQSLDKFRGESRFYTWVYRIAFNCCINHHDKHKQDRKNLSMDSENPDGSSPRALPDPGDGPEKIALERASIEIILSAIDRLPPRYSSVLLLREWHGFTYEEIASVQACTLSSVKTRIRRGRLLLIERLKPHFKAPGGEEEK